ncbi:hypothetical protein L2E82_05642 [Cichorium intybus]|uniref:Uncharacterized protein n=1 Tax=Cichorium intybus TaxID=13427 RepID=A0ACB9H7V0_CICIN|nr:hypothetical protein L2E82_05642 [Cichorium intybus]
MLNREIEVKIQSGQLCYMIPRLMAKQLECITAVEDRGKVTTKSEIFMPCYHQKKSDHHIEHEEFVFTKSDHVQGMYKGDKPILIKRLGIGTIISKRRRALRLQHRENQFEHTQEKEIKLQEHQEMSRVNDEARQQKDMAEKERISNRKLATLGQLLTKAARRFLQALKVQSMSIEIGGLNWHK